MWAQSFFVTSVRGSALLPTTSAKAADGCIGFMNAAFGLRFAIFLLLGVWGFTSRAYSKGRFCLPAFFLLFRRTEVPLSSMRQPSPEASRATPYSEKAKKKLVNK